MMSWTRDDLDKIAVSDDLHVAPFREDGKTYGTPTWIWSVVVEGALMGAEKTVRLLGGVVMNMNIMSIP